jgi:hypothetical protein
MVYGPGSGGIRFLAVEFVMFVVATVTGLVGPDDELSAAGLSYPPPPLLLR